MALNRLKTATLLAGLAGAVLLPGAAQAQFYFDTWGGRFDVPLSRDDGPDYDRPYRGYRTYREDRPYREAAQLSRGEVAAMLSRRGFRVNASIARNNDVYLVDAVDPSGRRLRLVVDIYDGSVLERIATGRDSEPPVRGLARREDPDTYFDDDFGPPPARGAEPRVITGVGPAQRKPAPKKEKPATARVEPRAPAPKPATTPPAPQAAPTTPSAAAPAPAAAAQAKTAAPQARAEAPAAPAAASEPSPSTGPRVIPLYKTPSEGDGGKPAEGAP